MTEQPSGAANPAQVKVGEVSFTWPVPDRTVQVGDRTISVDMAAVAAVYAVSGLWMLWAVRDVFTVFGSLIGGLFGSEFEFAFAWLVLLVVSMIVYVIGMLLYTAWTVGRGDPVGRGLSAVISASLLLLLFTSVRNGMLFAITLVAAICSAVLFVSPWARRVFIETERRRERPTSVVLSQTLTITYFAILGLVALWMVPGIRFVGDLGAKFFFFELLSLGAAAAGLIGYKRLTRGSRHQGRQLVSAAAGAVFVSQLITGSGAGVAVGLAVVAGIAGPLWLMPVARIWFGDKPLSAFTAPGPTTEIPETAPED